MRIYLIFKCSKEICLCIMKLAKINPENYIRKEKGVSNYS